MIKGTVSLKVNYHPSGRYTLSYKAIEGMYVDYGDKGLFGNDDQVAFYRATIRKIIDLVNDGYGINYEDTSDDGEAIRVRQF